MSFSYNNSLPTTKDKLRFLIQDTISDGHFLEDSEIEFVAGEFTNIYSAASQLCLTIATKINRQAGFKESDGIQYNPEQKASEYRHLASEFEQKAQTKVTLSVIPVSSATESDSKFTRDLHNP
jgi:hypothetical protein